MSSSDAASQTEKKSPTRPPLVVGWDAPLNKFLRKARSDPQVMTSPLPRLVDNFFTRLRRELAVDEYGPSV